jgi:uncharacterized YigZ family protein
VPFTLDPAARPQAEQTIKKSRFIARVRHVDSEAAAYAFISEVHEVERAAGHHCFGYIIGDDEPTRITRYNDDGEPSGTAGMPILQALRGKELVNVAAVVSRYWGGILLGAGGLSRAYSGTATLALEQARLLPRVRRELFRLTVDHADAGWVQADLRARGFVVVDVAYGAAAVFTLSCEDPDSLHSAVAAITSGRGELVGAGHHWR